MAEIELGRTYEDKVTGFTGIAVSSTTYLYACERVLLQAQAKDGDVKDGVFDAPQLVLVPKGKTIVVDVIGEKPLARTGGARPVASRPSANSR